MGGKLGFEIGGNTLMFYYQFTSMPKQHSKKRIQFSRTSKIFQNDQNPIKILYWYVIEKGLVFLTSQKYQYETISNSSMMGMNYLNWQVG